MLSIIFKFLYLPTPFYFLIYIFLTKYRFRNISFKNFFEDFSPILIIILCLLIGEIIQSNSPESNVLERRINLKYLWISLLIIESVIIIFIIYLWNKKSILDFDRISTVIYIFVISVFYHLTLVYASEANYYFMFFTYSITHFVLFLYLVSNILYITFKAFYAKIKVSSPDNRHPSRINS